LCLGVVSRNKTQRVTRGPLNHTLPFGQRL
jgi:hypothetical protein